jgi:lipid-A-disaccharide synthase
MTRNASTTGHHIFISCGEASGERYGAGLVSALRQLNPNLRFSASGGPALEKAGVQMVQRAHEIAVMGLTEVITALPELVAARRRIWRHLKQEAVDICLPIDFPGFNLRVAGRAHKLGIPVFYLIPPQLWAWGSWRIGQLKRNVDRVGTILPFEEDYFRRQGLEVIPLGHPLMDDYAHYPFEPLCVERESRFHDTELPLIIGLLPGSRKQEIKRLLPVLKVAAKMLHTWLAPRPVNFVVSIAPGLKRAPFLSYVGSGIEISQEPVPQLMRRLHLALVCSGTASLEASLAGVPHEMVYLTHWLNYQIGKRLLRVSRIGLPNLILGEDMVREHVQEDVSPVLLAQSLLKWVNVAQARTTFYNDARRLRQMCGQSGVWQRAATSILEFLNERSPVG